MYKLRTCFHIDTIFSYLVAAGMTGIQDTPVRSIPIECITNLTIDGVDDTDVELIGVREEGSHRTSIGNL